MAAENLTFDLLARDRATPTFRKISRSVDDTHRKFGFLAARTKHLTAGMRTSFGLVAGALGGIAAVSVFKSFIDEAREAGRVSRITTQVIKSTGGVAKVTAGHVGELANKLAEQAGVDDELIQTGANLLLTFKNVRNEVGKGNKVFDRATAAAVDLSAAGFGSVQSASKMLGKALNDPIKGMTALGRAGVTFSQKQKDQIKTLVEAGDVLSAQRIILKEVESQVGGAAKAAADPMARLSVVINNLKERIGTALLPVITVAASVLANKVAPAIGRLAEPLKRNVTPVLARFVGIVRKEAVPAFQSLAQWVTGSLIPALKNLWTTFGPLIIAIGQFALQAGRLAVELGTKLLAAIKPVTKWMADHKTLMQTLAVVVGTLVIGWKAYQAGIALVAAATKAYAAVQAGLNVVLAANPIGLTIIALAALAAGLVYAYKKSETFRDIVDGAFNTVWGAIKAVWDWLKKNWPLLLGILTGPIGLAVVAIIKYRDTIVNAFKTAWSTIKSTAKTAWTAIKDTVLGIVRTFVDKILGLFGAIINGAAAAFGWVPKLGGKLKDAAKKFNKFRDDVNTALGGIKDRHPEIKPRFAAPGGVNVVIKSGKGFAVGGRIPGAPSSRDNRVAPVASGEFIVNAQQTRKYLPLLEAINSGEGFASGGLVPRVATGAALAGVRRFSGSANAFMGRLATAFANAIGEALGAVVSGVPASVSGNARLVQSMAAKLYGWVGAQWTALYKLIMGESGFRNTAQNPTSSAYGMFQFLNGTWATVGGHKTSDPYLQSLYGLRYIKQNYWSPFNAYTKWSSRSPHWYDRGGWLMPGATLAVNNTGRPERVLPPGGGDSGRVDLSDKTIRAIGEVMGRVVLAGLGAANARSARTADLYARAG